jgi:hypothetical protein
MSGPTATQVLDRSASPSGPDRPPRRTGLDHPARWWRVGRALVGAVLAVLAAVAFAPAFGRTSVEALTDSRYALSVSGAAAAVACVCLILAIGTGVAPVSRLAAALAVLAGYVTLVVAPGWEVASGPKRLLTSTFPLEAEGAELATVVLVVGLATIGAVEPAVRRRAPALPLLAPAVATTLGSAVAAGAGAPAGWLAPAFAFGAAVLLALARYAPEPGRAAGFVDRPEYGPRVGGRAARRVVAGLLGCSVFAGVALVGWYGSALLSRTGRTTPTDARNLIPQEVQPREGTSPLVLYPALRRGEQALSLTVQAKVPPPQLRYVSLDSFDGEHWNTSAQYRRAGRRLPAGPETARRSATRHEEQVHVNDAGPLGWIVSSGRPVEVSVRGLGVNEDTGDVVLPADRPIPADYTVDSVLPSYDEDELTATAPLRTARMPALPRRFTELASDIVGNETGYPALRRLNEYFHPDPARPATVSRPDFRVDLTAGAPGGHGLHQIEGLLFDTQHGHYGTAEQYASAFAVLARAVGYDTRVVMGFRPRETGPGVYTVTGKDVHAWVEVRFASLGWVPFDPTPTRSTTDVNQAVPPPSRPSPSKSGQKDQATPPPKQGRPQTRQVAPADQRTRGYTELILVAVGGLLAAYAGLTPIAKSALRRRRRRMGGPGRRALAAWRDTLDRLAEAGLDVTPADTSGEVVAAARHRFGDRVALPVQRLARLYDEAAFAHPTLTEPAAEAAWHHADQARGEIRTAMRPFRRLRAELSVRAAWATGR